MSTRRGASSSRIKAEAEEVEVAPTSLSSLPPEIKLEIARCCSRNDAAFKSTYDRRWRAEDLDAALRTEYLEALATEGEESEAEFTDSEAGAPSEDASESSGDSESGEDEDASDAVAPLGFEQDPNWGLKSSSLVALYRVNREWYKLAAQVKFKSLQMNLVQSKHIISFVQDFLPQHGHHIRTINFPTTADPLVEHVSFETLLAFMPFMPNLNALILPSAIIPTPHPLPIPIPVPPAPINLALTPGLTILLQHILSKTSRLLIKHATDLSSIKSVLAALEPCALAAIKRLELPALSLTASPTLNPEDPDSATLATIIAQLPSLERVVVSFGDADRCLNRAIDAFINGAAPGMESRELRSSIELFGHRQIENRDYQHLCSLADSTWSLTIANHAANEGFDYLWAMRLSHLGLPLPTSFPRLQVLVLSDVETRTDEQVDEENEHWEIPTDFAVDGWDPRHDVRRIHPYTSPTGFYPDGTPHTPNDNLALYLLLLSSFDSSPLHTISLTGARLSFLLASPAFLPFLSQHLSTLKQLIIVSGDNSPDGAAHRRLAAFCDANDVRLAFEGTYSPRDPPIDEMKERMEEILKVARREGEKIMERGDHEALERLFAGIVEAERKA